MKNLYSVIKISNKTEKHGLIENFQLYVKMEYYKLKIVLTYKVESKFTNGNM